MTSASEILRQRLAARARLPEFARVVGFQPALHHRYLCEKLEAVENGRIKKLAFFLPPGSSSCRPEVLLAARKFEIDLLPTV
jgi:hypothetical protein